MTKPPKESTPNIHDTPSVKVKVTHDRLVKKIFRIQLQGLMLNAIDDCIKDRGETYQQYLTDLLEKDLVKEKYLPDWWFERGRGIR